MAFIGMGGIFFMFFFSCQNVSGAIMGKFATATKWSLKLGVAGGALFLAGRERFFGTQEVRERAQNQRYFMPI